MEGMIFAAGLGTRLRPLTNNRPKAMVELAGRPLLEHVIQRMRKAGVGKIVVNVHHYADQVVDFLRKEGYLDENVIVSNEKEQLLDTGGGLLQARKYFTPGESVMIHNVDIFSKIDLKSLIKSHGDNYATLVVRNSQPGRGLRFNAEGLLKGWENSLSGEKKIVDDGFYEATNYSFCGVHIVSPEFLLNMEGKGVFSIIDEYLLQAKKQKIHMYYYSDFFMDLGTPQALEEANEKVNMQGII